MLLLNRQYTRTVTQVFSGIKWGLGILVPLSRKNVIFNYVLPPWLVNTINAAKGCMGGGWNVCECVLARV